MSKIMELADKCIATYAWHGTTDYMIVDDGKARDTLAAAIQAEQDYTHAVIAERDEALKECEEQARLLGMSGSREAALLSERDQLRKELAELREAEPVQEPVAWLSYGDVSTKRSDFGHAQVTPLYAAPDGLRKAAQTALYLLKENLIAFGPCDHDVGICNCDIEQCIDLLRKELGQ